jgi:hypothetical protein
MRGQKEFVLLSMAVVLGGGLAACSGSNLPPPSPERSATSALAPDSKPPEAATDPKAAPKERSISDCASVGEPMAAAGTALGGQERKDLLASMMQKHRDKFRCCYDVARRQNPTLNKGGAFVVEFQLKTDGTIKSAGTNRDKSEIKDDVMDTCASAVARTFVFPPSAEGKESTVPYPYTFTAQGNSKL